MATSLPNADMTYLHTLEQAKQEFWSRNSHLSQQQRRELWFQAAASNVFDVSSSSTPASHVPRSMPLNTSYLAQSPVWNTPLVTRPSSNTI